MSPSSLKINLVILTQYLKYSIRRFSFWFDFFPPFLMATRVHPLESLLNRAFHLSSPTVPLQHAQLFFSLYKEESEAYAHFKATKQV